MAGDWLWCRGVFGEVEFAKPDGWWGGVAGAAATKA